MLSSIKTLFGHKWKYVGLHLNLNYDDVLRNIERDVKEVADQTFRMFQEWLDRDVSSCYCKLIFAMKNEGLDSAAEILKNKIKLTKPV